MAKTHCPYVPQQDLLLPPSLRNWLPEGHLAFLVNDLVEQLDLSSIPRVYEDDERGYSPYHPAHREPLRPVLHDQAGRVGHWSDAQSPDHRGTRRDADARESRYGPGGLARSSGYQRRCLESFTVGTTSGLRSRKAADP